MNKRTGAIMVAAALLLFAPALITAAHAQSSGNNGVSNFLGNLFSGPKSATSPQARMAPPAIP